MADAIQNQQVVAKYAGLQAVAEVGVGSLLHSLHVPLTGHVLSLNQSAIFTWATKSELPRRQMVSTLSALAVVAALLKVFSPIGKRLTPMLAISVQGFLFTLGVAVFGVNFVGVTMGALLLSLWAFLQPLLIAYLLFGSPFFQALIALWVELATTLGIDPQWGGLVLIGLVLGKLILAMILVNWVWWRGRQLEERYVLHIQKLGSQRAGFTTSIQTPSSPQNPWRLALVDMVNPWFLLSLGISVGFFVFSGRPGQWQIFYYVVRVLLAAWLLFLAARSFRGLWLAGRLKRWPLVDQALTQVFGSWPRT